MSVTSTVVDRAEIRFHAARPALQPYVGCFWVVTAQCGATVRVVPDGTTSIGIEQRRDRGADVYLRGPLLQPAELKFAVPTTLVGVRLRPGVAFSLTEVSLHSMVNRRAALSDYVAFSGLNAIGALPQTPIEWIAALQAFLIERLEGTTIHPLVARALAVIQAAHGCVSVRDIADRCDASERHLSRLMRDWIGYGPKRYANMVRFQSTLARMERAPEMAVASLAADAGYFDQSHLSVDVARHAGATPRDLMSEHVSDFSKTRCEVPF